jgi:ubiquinone/menaquinone biosynthesis C-methylase UbiE
MRNLQRSPFAYKIKRAIQSPQLIIPKLERTVRNALIKIDHRDHIGFYREVMARQTSLSPDLAVGSANRQHWLDIGKFQFDYLLQHGLQPSHKVLEIGCGNLRAGWRIISHVQPGNYIGVDISPHILLAAQKTVAEFRLQDKVPYLVFLADMRFEFLPDCYFDVIHAHSVFTHCSRDVIELCLANIGRIMKPQGFFDFTFFASDKRADGAYDITNEDFYYPTSEMLALVRSRGFEANQMDDWDYSQAKIRVTKRS